MPASGSSGRQFRKFGAERAAGDAERFSRRQRIEGQRRINPFQARRAAIVAGKSSPYAERRPGETRRQVQRNGSDKVIPPHYVADPRPGQTRGVPLRRQGSWRPWRPILRGAEAKRGDILSGAFRRCLVASDGAIEYRVIRLRNDGTDTGLHANVHQFHGWEVMNFACAALVSAERFRQAAGHPSVEYALDVCIAVHGLRLKLADQGFANYLPWTDEDALLEPGDYPFPRYSVGDRSEFPGSRR